MVTAPWQGSGRTHVGTSPPGDQGTANPLGGPSHNNNTNNSNDNNNTNNNKSNKNKNKNKNKNNNNNNNNNSSNNNNDDNNNNNDDNNNNNNNNNNNFLKVHPGSRSGSGWTWGWSFQSSSLAFLGLNWPRKAPHLSFPRFCRGLRGMGARACRRRRISFGLQAEVTGGPRKCVERCSALWD